MGNTKIFLIEVVVDSLLELPHMFAYWNFNVFGTSKLKYSAHLFIDQFKTLTFHPEMESSWWVSERLQCHTESSYFTGLHADPPTTNIIGPKLGAHSTCIYTINTILFCVEEETFKYQLFLLCFVVFVSSYKRFRKFFQLINIWLKAVNFVEGS